jgi:hypothetical protein
MTTTQTCRFEAQFPISQISTPERNIKTAERKKGRKK